ncbi:MAG: GNAT family N-acetyltransferase [Thermodesulfobacteriota bacterium]
MREIKPAKTDLTLRCLTPDDLSEADNLRAALGWNQTISDWQRMLSLAPDACFAAEQDGRIVGTCTTVSYGKTLAWIGMMMVHPDHRRQGIGSALLRHCVTYLRRCGVRCIKLDATPMGQPLYAGMGFLPEWTITRWEHRGSPLPIEQASACIQPLADRHWQAIQALDTPIFGAQRDRLLQSLAAKSQRPLVYERGDSVLALGMLRRKATVDYLGPIAAFPGTGEPLVRCLLSGHNDQPIYWDIPDQNEPASRLARELGFTRVRSLTRMYLDTNPVPGDPLGQWAIADPATG